MLPLDHVIVFGERHLRRILASYLRLVGKFGYMVADPIFLARRLPPSPHWPAASPGVRPRLSVT